MHSAWIIIRHPNDKKKVLLRVAGPPLWSGVGFHDFYMCGPGRCFAQMVGVLFPFFFSCLFFVPSSFDHRT